MKHETATPAAPPPSPVATARPVALAGSPSDWVLAFQETQRQTAEAHAVYQRAMAESHSSFLRVAESGMLGLTAMVTGQPLSVPAPQPAREMAPRIRPRAAGARLGPGSGSGAGSGSLACRLRRRGAEAVRGPVRVARRPAGRRAASLPPRSPSRVSAPVAKRTDIDLQALMLSVVAEKTGYPADMLNLAMDLEGDLGIDSIKRVEILSAVADQAPELRSVDMGHMGSLRTLGAIVEYMKSLGPQDAAAPATGGGVSDVDLQALMLRSWRRRRATRPTC